MFHIFCPWNFKNLDERVGVVVRTGMV